MLSLMLSGCSTVVVQKVPVGPPTELYAESTEKAPTAPPRGSTNEALVRYVLALKDHVRELYDDRAAIRVWAGCALDTKVKNDGCK